MSQVIRSNRKEEFLVAASREARSYSKEYDIGNLDRDHKSFMLFKNLFDTKKIHGRLNADGEFVIYFRTEMRPSIGD